MIFRSLQSGSKSKTSAVEFSSSSTDADKSASASSSASSKSSHLSSSNSCPSRHHGASKSSRSSRSSSSRHMYNNCTRSRPANPVPSAWSAPAGDAGEAKKTPAASHQPQGAIIESMQHHGKGVFSGTFSGQLLSLYMHLLFVGNISFMLLLKFS